MHVIRLLGAALLLSLAQTGRADVAPSAAETFQHLQQGLVRDKGRGDWGAFLVDAERLSNFLNGSPTSKLELARAHLQLGQGASALEETRHFLDMGQTNDILNAPLFSPLRAGLEPQIKSNRSPVARARASFLLADAGLLPEDIDYDPVSKRFLVTSILEHKVIELDASRRQRDFADAPDHWPMIALKVDAKRRRLWATEVALDGFSAVAPNDWGRSVLLKYDLDRGTLLARYEGAAHSNLGDMVLAENGDPIVSDGDGGGIYRLDGDALRRIDHGDFISPQTLAICDDGKHAFVPDYVRGLASFDLATGAVAWMSTQQRYALDGIDGLYCRGNSLIAVQNGSSPQRVVVFALDRSMSEIEAEKIVERATNSLGDPTHGVLIGKRFFYIANSGWSAIDEHGAPKPSAGLTRASVMRADKLL